MSSGPMDRHGVLEKDRSGGYVIHLEEVEACGKGRE
jgi:hypothetical protein